MGKLKDQIPLFITKFAVFPRYEIVNYQGKRMITIAKGSNKPLKEARFYSPADVESIFTHLARVETEKDLLSFAHRFGLLGLEDRKLRPPQYGPYLGFAHDYVEDSLKAARDVELIINEIDRLDNQAINPKLTPYLKQIALDQINIYPDWKSKLKDADISTLLRASVAITISEHMDGTRPIITLTDAREMAPGYAYLSLYDAIWHQIYFAFTGFDKMKRCPACGLYHTGRSQFCPPPPFYNRSPCENTFHQKRHYRIKKKVLEAFHEGKTPDAIAEELDIDIDQIKKWIEKEVQS